jgi:hypothetical protein
MHRRRKADYERFVSLATDYPWHQIGSTSFLILAQAMLRNGICDLKQRIDRQFQQFNNSMQQLDQHFIQLEHKHLCPDNCTKTHVHTLLTPHTQELVQRNA